MKIIHLVLGKANPKRMNGVNKVVNSLASYQTVLGQDVTLWGITHSPDAPVPTRNYQTRLFPALKHKLWLHPSIKQAVKDIKRATIFHLHGGFIPEFYHISKLLNKYHIPFVHTPHGAYNTVAMQRSKHLKKVYFTCFEKTILAQAKTLHFIGKSEVEAIHRLTQPSRCKLIPNGQQSTRQSFVKKEKKHAPIFGFCGRLDIHTKGLDLLIKAFANYQKHHPSATLWIIGDSAERIQLEQLSEDLGITKQVVFWGKKFGKEKENLLAQMDIFFHPSRNEGLPGAVLEAAAMGIPCVVSKESNVGEYITQFEAGMCLANNDVKQLTSAMLDMHTDWEEEAVYQQICQNAVTMIQEKFDWNHIADQHIAMYFQVLSPSLQTS